MSAGPEAELRLEFLVRDVARLLRRRFEQSAQELGLSLTRAQSFVLVHVAREPGLSQARLAHLMDVEPIALVRLIDRLEAEALLERRLDPRDRRVWRLYLTGKAAPTLDHIRHISTAITGRALASVAPQESSALLTILQRLKTNLSSVSPSLALAAPDGDERTLAAPEARVKP
jgi:MarR family transcriptional regulator, transcriptional regulator for hemolysin